MNISDAISRHARVTPGRAALIEPETARSRSWRELETRTNALVAAFAQIGIRRGDRVGVISKNRIEYLEIYIACAKYGCITHGINWRFALPAMVEALHDSKPALVLVETEFAERARELKRELDIAEWREFSAAPDSSYEDLIASGANADVAVHSGDDDPVMIIYTGGTTGDSKGALHSHRSVATAMANNTIAERIVPTDCYMLLGQAFHSSAVLALNYLHHGCPVVVVDFDPRTALEAIDECAVTAFLGYPTMLTYMLEAGTAGRHDLSTLRNIQYGGGMFADATISALLDTFPCTLIQCYGTTESVGVTFLSQEDHARARHEQPGLLRSCGLPAFLTEVKLVPDPANVAEYEGRPIGEIHVKSASNMLGYWSDWLARDRAARPEWLPTGDLAVADEQGYLYIVGRSKDVIISGGENIYAPQVENAIYSHEAVLEAAVIGVPDETWGESPVAVVVLRPGMTVSGEEIQELVRVQLGSYQKPRSVTFIDALPRTPTGKIMKRALVEIVPSTYWFGESAGA